MGDRPAVPYEAILITNEGVMLMIEMRRKTEECEPQSSISGVGGKKKKKRKKKKKKKKK